MKVMVGGTFDPLHIGHQLLLSRAFATAGVNGFVIIGLSSDKFAIPRKHHRVRPYEIRKSELVSWIEKSEFQTPYVIEELNDPFGSSLTADFDALIVSFETFSVGNLINQKRKEAGLHMVDLYQIQCVLAKDGKAVSSTRIYRGEINRYGELEPEQSFLRESGGKN